MGDMQLTGNNINLDFDSTQNNQNQAFFSNTQSINSNFFIQPANDIQKQNNIYNTGELANQRYSYMNDEYSYGTSYMNSNQQYDGLADAYSFNPEDTSYMYGGYMYGDNTYDDNTYNNMYGDEVYGNNVSMSGVMGYDENYAGYYDEQQFTMNYAQEEEEPFITVKDLLSFGICIVLAFILAYISVTYVAQHTMVSGTSMAYNLADKDILIVDRLTYRINEPERFDIVIFPVSDDSFYIKRVIGLPGEHVQVIKEDGNIYINGEILEEDYGFEDNKIFPDNCDVMLDEDEYYVMGDNRNDSEDSRFSKIGEINRDIIIGKAIFRIWPISSFGQIDDSYNANIKAGMNEKPYLLH